MSGFRMSPVFEWSDFGSPLYITYVMRVVLLVHFYLVLYLYGIKKKLLSRYGFQDCFKGSSNFGLFEGRHLWRLLICCVFRPASACLGMHLHGLKQWKTMKNAWKSSQSTFFWGGGVSSLKAHVASRPWRMFLGNFLGLITSNLF